MPATSPQPDNDQPGNDTTRDRRRGIGQTGTVTTHDAELRRGEGDMHAARRLATYGTLAPGQPNHHQLDGLDGRWLRGHVHGRLVDAGWGASLGYPGLVLDPDGPAVDVSVFESGDLPQHWARLDEFEGSGYQRAPTTVRTAEGNLDAFIYLPIQTQQ